jgi:hypothetical protein
MHSAHIRRRFWFEAGLALVSFVLMIATLVSREWIEAVFGWEPDGGNGVVEWALVVGFALVTVLASLVARVEWRNAHVAGVA